MDSELNKIIDERIRTSNRQSKVNAIVTCSAVGKPMVMEVYKDSTSVCVSTEIDSVQALKRATDEETLNKQFSKTKDSWASFDHIEYHLGKDIYFPISVMNQLRRDALEKMKEACLKQEPLVEKEYSYIPQESKTSFDLFEINSMNQKVDDSSCYVSEMFNSNQILENQI